MRKRIGYLIVVIFLMLVCVACSPAFNLLSSSPDVSRSNMYDVFNTVKMIVVIHSAVLVIALLMTLLSRMLSVFMLLVTSISSVLFAVRIFEIWRDMIGMHTSDAISVRGDMGGLLCLLIFISLGSIVVFAYQLSKFKGPTAPSDKKPPINYFEEW